MVAGSTLGEELDRDVLSGADLVVAVDGGADALARVGVVPALVVGDLDSISPRVLEDLRARRVEVLALPRAKDETDTEAALRALIGRGATEVTVYGALGGPRLDHLLGNLLVLTAPWLATVRVKLVEGHHEAFLAKGDGCVSGSPGDTVSLLPLTPVVEDVQTTGLLYPLHGEPLLQAQTRGLSNEMTGVEARVTHGAGVLLLIHYRGR
jgi:thiamine pyrophosphokinase